MQPAGLQSDRDGRQRRLYRGLARVFAALKGTARARTQWVARATWLGLSVAGAATGTGGR
jgi:hypothetical protein